MCENPLQQDDNLVIKPPPTKNLNVINVTASNTGALTVDENRCERLEGNYLIFL